MDRRGGCCIARYAAGGAYDMSKVDRIMLKFRPIAPKPTSSGSGSGGSSPEKTDACVKTCRGKRKYVRDGNNKRCYNRKRKSSPEETEKKSVSGGDTVVTLPLLPETPDRNLSPASSENKAKNAPIWLNFGGGGGDKAENNFHNHEDDVALGSDRTAVVMTPQPVRVVGSIVTVETITDTWVGGDGLGRTDDERRFNLRRDTCPGFISDGLNRVVWANGAYREMVGQDDHDGEVIVWLVMRERAPEIFYPAFTCRVRVQYTCGKEKGSLTLPCDVWRMDGGGFAWRLDVKAALSLGR